LLGLRRTQADEGGGGVGSYAYSSKSIRPIKPARSAHEGWGGDVRFAGGGRGEMGEL